MTLSPSDPGPPCSECDSYCGVDAYEWWGKDVCSWCRNQLVLKGVIVGECVRCGALLDDDMPMLLDSSLKRICEKCNAEEE